MKTGTKVLAAIAAAGAVALGGFYAAPSYAQEKCLYEAVSAYPALPVDKPALDVVEACKGLSGPEKAQLRGMVSRFVTSATVKAAQGG